MKTKCDRCGKGAKYLICFGSEDICQNCLDIETGKRPEKKESLEDMLFSDQKVKHECTKCGSPDDLIVSHTRENGDPIYICKECKAQRDRERAEKAQRSRNSAAASLARDRYEERF